MKDAVTNERARNKRANFYFQLVDINLAKASQHFFPFPSTQGPHLQATRTDPLTPKPHDERKTNTKRKDVFTSALSASYGSVLTL